MEEEVKSMSIPSRPKNPQDYAKANLEDNYGKKVSDKERKTMIKHMQSVKKGEFSNNTYVNMKTCVDWRSIPSKKVDRDWARYIIAIILEPILVPQYRPQLLIKSPAAAYLRAMAHTLLSNHCRRRLTLDGEKQSYIFVDGIETPNLTPTKPVVNVELAISNRERRANLETMRKELIGVISKFEKIKGVAAKPGSNLMAKDIKTAFDDVVEVSYLLFICHFY